MGNNSTIDYYNQNAEQYFEQTVHGKMQEAYDTFMMFLPEGAYILDFGCGSGRDSKHFLSKGYSVKAIDGSEKLAKLASEYIGQPVETMDFSELKDELTYDGIWACSSIIHVEREKLPDILKKMITALKEDGVIYTCFKKGDKCEIQEGKYYNFMTRKLLEQMLREIEPKAKVVKYYESTTYKDVNRPSATWGNYLIKKNGNTV